MTAEAVTEVLEALGAANETGRISYRLYSELHDLVSAIVPAPTVLTFNGLKVGDHWEGEPPNDCPEKDGSENSWFCTRPKGHAGKHAASNGSELLAIWDATPERIHAEHVTPGLVSGRAFTIPELQAAERLGFADWNRTRGWGGPAFWATGVGPNINMDHLRRLREAIDLVLPALEREWDNSAPVPRPETDDKS